MKDTLFVDLQTRLSMSRKGSWFLGMMAIIQQCNIQFNSVEMISSNIHSCFQKEWRGGFSKHCSFSILSLKSRVLFLLHIKWAQTESCDEHQGKEKWKEEKTSVAGWASQVIIHWKAWFTTGHQPLLLSVLLHALNPDSSAGTPQQHGLARSAIRCWTPLATSVILQCYLYMLLLVFSSLRMKAYVWNVEIVCLNDAKKTRMRKSDEIRNSSTMWQCKKNSRRNALHC